MQKLLATLVITLAVSTLFSQEKGQLIIGGGLLYNSSYEEDSNLKNSSLNVSVGPFTGLMITDRIAAGLQAIYNVDYTEIEDKTTGFGSVSDIKSMTIGLFGRLHGKFTDRLLYTVQLNLGKDFRLNGNAPHPEVYRASATTGLLYFVAERVGLGINVASLNFRSETHKPSDYKRRDLGIDYNILNPQLEVVFYL